MLKEGEEAFQAVEIENLVGDLKVASECGCSQRDSSKRRLAFIDFRKEASVIDLVTIF